MFHDRRAGYNEQQLSNALALAVFEADFIEKPRNTLGNVVSNPFLYKADIVAHVSVKRLQRG